MLPMIPAPSRFSTVVFDMGGVVFSLDFPQAVRRFVEIGVSEAPKYLDPYHQAGIFGLLEQGLISREEFRVRLSELCGKALTLEECRYAWMGFIGSVPPGPLETILRLREAGYRTLLLSNTNAFITEWGRSPAFDGRGHSMYHYLDELYFSCECRIMKPDPAIFRFLLERENLTPGECIFIDDGPANVAAAEALGFTTLCPVGNSDWTPDLLKLLSEQA